MLRLILYRVLWKRKTSPVSRYTIFYSVAQVSATPHIIPLKLDLQITFVSEHAFRYMYILLPRVQYHLETLSEHHNIAVLLPLRPPRTPLKSLLWLTPKSPCTPPPSGTAAVPGTDGIAIALLLEFLPAWACSNCPWKPDGWNWKSKEWG